MTALGSFRDMLSDKSLETLYQDTPAGERSSKIEAIELEAINSLKVALGNKKTSLLTALKPELEVLTKSGLVTVRARAAEVLSGVK
jgi:hypothetical protein